MFGIDGVDLVIILVLAVLLFGPEKLPEYSRKAARIFVYLRDIANNAKSTLGNELGPEFADLELKDLNPKAFVAKHLREEIALIDEVKKELQDSAKVIKDATDQAGAATRLDGEAIATASAPLALGAPAGTPFDAEAT